MKKIIPAIILVLFVTGVLVFVLRHPNKSYISFERDCIEVKALQFGFYIRQLWKLGPAHE